MSPIIFALVFVVCFGFASLTFFHAFRPTDQLSPRPPDLQQYPGTKEGARAMLSEFLKPGADYAALTSSLKPGENDYAAVFEPEFAFKAASAYARL